MELHFFPPFLLCLISCIAGASVYPADFPSMYRHLAKHQATTPLPRLSPADDITARWQQIHGLYLNKSNPLQSL